MARITHDPGTLADPEVRVAVETAVELSAHNAPFARRPRVSAGRAGGAARAGRRRSARGRGAGSTGRERRARADHRPGAATPGDDPADGAARWRCRQRRPRDRRAEAARVEIRDLARGLAPASLAEGGLADALRDLAVRSSVEVDLDVPPGVTGGPGPDATVYFVCAEALANVARHARASHVRIARRGDGDRHLGRRRRRRCRGRGSRPRVRFAGPGGPRGGDGWDAEGRVRAGQGTRLAATIPIAREALSPA